MDSVPETKVCSKCGQQKPVEDYYVKIKKTGRRMSWCKPCHNAMTLKSYRADIEANRKKHREAKRQLYAANPEAAARKVREWRAANPEKNKEIADRSEVKRIEHRREYRRANRERRRAYCIWYRATHADQINASSVEYRQKNREVLRERIRRWREENREMDYWIHSRWKERNRDMVNASGNRRRCKQTDNGGDYTAEQWQALKRLCDDRCLRCGKDETETGGLCVDHVIPVNEGGPNSIDNLQPLCRPCNSAKGTRRWDFRWWRKPDDRDSQE